MIGETMLRSLSGFPSFLSIRTTRVVSKRAAVSPIFESSRPHSNKRAIVDNYISDPSLAEITARELELDIAKGRLILESSPGPGILSRRLLELGCKKLHLFTPQKSQFLKQLNEIKDENPTRVKIFLEDFVRMASVAQFDLHNGTDRMSSFLTDFPDQSWDAEPSVTAVIPITRAVERKFILTLLYTFSSRTMIFSRGRVDLLIFMSSNEYQTLTRTSARNSTRVLLDLFFDCKQLRTLSSDSFSFRERRKRKDQQYEMCLLRLTPKADIFGRLGDLQKVEEFLSFVKQAYRRGATLMYLNQLIPDSVRYVLLRTRWSQTELPNLHYETKLSSLAPEEILRVFEILSTHKLYPECPIPADLDSDSFKRAGSIKSSHCI